MEEVERLNGIDIDKKIILANIRAFLIKCQTIFINPILI